MSDSLSLALDWPAGAASAALTVAKGMDRDTAEVTDTTATALPLEIVFPTEEKSEGVLELTLVYKDAQGEALDTQTARLGLVRGVGAATARCILDASVRQWSVVKGSAVMPIPEGTTELSVNANSVGPLDAPGWWLWQIEENGDYTFSLTASGETREVQLVGKKTGGLILLVR